MLLYILSKCCVQGLTTRHSRHLVVMRKTRQYSMELYSSFLAYRDDVLSGRDQGFCLLMAKLERALAAAAHTDAEVVKQASQCCLKRKQKREKRIKLRESGQIWSSNNLSTSQEQESKSNEHSNQIPDVEGEEKE